MSYDPELQAIDHELRRIGVDPAELSGVILPGSVSVPQFVQLLREIPDNAGIDAYDELIRSLFSDPMPPWEEWPDPGSRFSESDLVAALSLLNLSPLHETAQEYATPPQKIPTWLLALLSLTSMELGARVAEYLDDVRRDRFAAGVSSEIIESADARFDALRERLKERIGRVAEELRKLEGRSPGRDRTE